MEKFWASGTEVSTNLVCYSGQSINRGDLTRFNHTNLCSGLAFYADYETMRPVDFKQTGINPGLNQGHLSWNCKWSRPSSSD